MSAISPFVDNLLHDKCLSVLLIHNVQGVLSLLARRGGRGLPAGHVVAYQPTHSLHAAFVRELLHATQTMS